MYKYGHCAAKERFYISQEHITQCYGGTDTDMNTQHYGHSNAHYVFDSLVAD